MIITFYAVFSVLGQAQKIISSSNILIIILNFDQSHALFVATGFMVRIIAGIMKSGIMRELMIDTNVIVVSLHIGLGAGLGGIR